MPDAEALLAQLEEAQAIIHMGSWQWDVATGAVTWSDELYRIYGLEPRSRAITLEYFLSRLHDDDRERIQDAIQRVLQQPGGFAYRETIVMPDGSRRILDTIGRALVGGDGAVTGLLGTCRDITEQIRGEELIRRGRVLQLAERTALEMLASDAPLGAIFSVMLDAIEAISVGTLASILVLDETGTRLGHGAARRLPAEYVAAIDGRSIGPAAGSCGTAAYRRERVIVEDIETDPLWADYRGFALAHGLRACWSSPILASTGRVLGTFALYRREPGAPDPDTLELMARASHVVGIAIERRELDDQLRALAARIEAIREDERTTIARDIHDQLGQALTAVKLDVAWLARRCTDAALTKKLDEMARTTDELLRSVRRISADLRPSILDDAGLHAAIEWQAEEFARRGGTRCEVHSEIGEIQLDRELATSVFRILQEALTNVARHANATVVTIALRLDHGQLCLEVADDGIGLPEIGPRNSTLGILGMGERARRLGGDCVVARRPARGTSVTLRVPLRFPSEHVLEARRVSSPKL